MKTLRFGVPAVVFACLTVLASARGEEPALAVEKNPSDPTGFAVVKFKLSKGDDVVWEVRPKPAAQKSYRDGEYAYLILNGPEGVTYEVTADWINWDAKKRGRPYENVLIGKAPQPPPVPPTPPGPTPPGPVPPGPQPPEPVTSFYVIIVYEGTATYPLGTIPLIDGVKIEEWLTKNCTGGKIGYAKTDKDRPDGTTFPATLAQMWTKAREGLDPARVPCYAIAVNGKIYYEPLLVDGKPRTVEDALAVLAKYRGGK